jgi:hypothetical protein
MNWKRALVRLSIVLTVLWAFASFYIASGHFSEGWSHTGDYQIGKSTMTRAYKLCGLKQLFGGRLEWQFCGVVSSRAFGSCVAFTNDTQFN